MDETLEPWERQEHKIAQGFVPCDDLECTARMNPVSPDEINTAYLHWRYHSFLHGCAHGE